MTISRSGDLYLVARGPVGQLVPTDGRRPFPPGNLKAIIAHCNVSDPWADVDPSGPLPEAVEKVVESSATWHVSDELA